MELEDRITRLEDIEAIRYLQAKYQRCLDTRDFDGLASCFDEDAVSSYDNGKLAYHGKEEIVHYLCSVMTLNMPSAHFIHGGEIDWLNKTHAKGKWYLEDHLYHDKYLSEIHGAAIYSVEYLKKGSKWLIASIGYERCYEYIKPRGLFNLLTLHKRTFLKRVKKADPMELEEYGQYFQFHTLKKK